MGPEPVRRPRYQRMRSGEIQEVKVETFDERLVSGYDAVPEKVGTTYLAMIVHTVLSPSTMALAAFC